MESLTIKAETSIDEIIFPAKTEKKTIETIIAYVVLQIEKRYDEVYLPVK